LAATFFVAATVQLMPASMALAADGIHQADMSGCDQPKPPPCPDRSPYCVDNFGCLSVPALPIAPTALAAPYQWAITIAYDFGSAPLLGRSIKPELSPPITVA